MFCGFMKETCDGITVGRLIEILSKCRNNDAKIQVASSERFFIHFDQDGELISFTKSACDKEYGDRGNNNRCIECADYDKKDCCCKCDPMNCMNYLGNYSEMYNSPAVIGKDIKADEFKIKDEPIGIQETFKDPVEQSDVDKMLINSFERIIETLKKGDNNGD